MEEIERQKREAQVLLKEKEAEIDRVRSMQIDEVEDVEGLEEMETDVTAGLFEAPDVDQMDDTLQDRLEAYLVMKRIAVERKELVKQVVNGIGAEGGNGKWGKLVAACLGVDEEEIEDRKSFTKKSGASSEPRKSKTEAD